MLNVLVVDEPGFFRDGMMKSLVETGLTVHAVDAIDDVSREAATDLTIMLWATNFDRPKDFVTLRRLLSANRALRAIIIADRPSRILLDAAHNNGAKALILRNTPADLLRGTIDLVAIGGSVFPVYPITALDMGTAGFPVDAVKERLTPTELNVVMHLAEDLTNEQIASAMDIAVSTVKTHLKNIHVRLGALSRAGIVAICAGLKPPGTPPQARAA